ncbi:RxLR effector protein [Phytophthora megakarya]|uniref:RxLR effector protein n=1 Tax=Phytophthora megakarya TaxID=4795 RepID=A0A225V1J3_9STRA|nr:RxLR effector protein [Phytophthora megakarya]
MRLSSFLAPVVTIFIVCCTNSTNAENVVEGRRLRAEVQVVPPERAANLATKYIAKLKTLTFDKKVDAKYVPDFQALSLLKNGDDIRAALKNFVSVSNKVKIDPEMKRKFLLAAAKVKVD